MNILIHSIALAAAAAHPSPAQSAQPTAYLPMTRSRHGLKAVGYANIDALIEPNGDGFTNAVQVYPWSQGSIYRLFTAPGLVSDIELQPGEALISVAAGDTSRWIIGDTSSGSGTAKRTHILVKPIASGLRTNLVITTDRRVYLLALASTSGPGMAAISWSYPQDELIAYRASERAALDSAPVAEGDAVERLNFNYRIEGNPAPWTPIRVFDDGRQTFVEFPESIGFGEIPPLFVIGPSGNAELVNYRLSGRYYVVDRLFSQAELRLGTKHQLVVRIVRVDRPKRGRM